MIHRRRGYVLLVTLGLLVLSSSLLVAVARSAVRHSADAAIEQRRVERHWAIETARAATLPFAEQILVTAEQSRGQTLPYVTADVRLGGMTLTLTVADEQAKANVNELLTRDTPAGVEDRLRRTLTNATAKARLRIRPAPQELTKVRENETATKLPAVSGFGQIFDDVSSAALFPSNGTSPLDTLTLWGDGGLNVLRSGRAAMRTALTPALSTVQIDRLLAARGKIASGLDAAGPTNATDAVAGLLDRAGITGVNRAKLPMVGRSACHSVRVVLNDGRRVWYDLAVLDASDPRLPRRFAVDW